MTVVSLTVASLLVLLKNELFWSYYPGNFNCATEHLFWRIVFSDCFKELLNHKGVNVNVQCHKCSVSISQSISSSYHHSKTLMLITSLCQWFLLYLKYKWACHSEICSVLSMLRSVLFWDDPALNDRSLWDF